MVASLLVDVKVDVDGEMGIDVTHLVLEALGDTDDQVVDKGADGAESGNVLAVAMVDLEANNALLDDGEVDGDVAQVLGELACWSALLGYCFSPERDSRIVRSCSRLQSEDCEFLLTTGALNRYKSRLDGDLDCIAKSVSNCPCFH